MCYGKNYSRAYIQKPFALASSIAYKHNQLVLRTHYSLYFMEINAAFNLRFSKFSALAPRIRLSHSLPYPQINLLCSLIPL